MKNGLKILPLIFLIVMVMLGSIACSNLKVDNLKANEHFKKANKFYSEEKFKKAVNEYEAALQFNPELKISYKYMGTALAMLYKPGDESADNKQTGQKAQEYLKKAQEYEPDDNKIILALGQLSDKMRNFAEAEKQFEKVLNKETDKKKKAQIYVILAQFYQNYPDKEDKVIEMYQNRIDLDPDDPDGYVFMATHYFDHKKWDDALKYYELMLTKIEQSTTLDEKGKKGKMTDTLYRIGHLCWAHSYQTPTDPPMMSKEERNQIISKGMENLTKATELSPTRPDPWVYLGLLWLEKDKVDPAKHDQHQAKRDELVKKYQELVKLKKSNEEMVRNLQREK